MSIKLCLEQCAQLFTGELWLCRATVLHVMINAVIVFIYVSVKYALVPATRAHTGEGKSEEEKMQEWMGWGWGKTFHTDWSLSSKPSWEHEGYVGERLCPKIHGPVFFQIRHGSFQLITWVLKRYMCSMCEWVFILSVCFSFSCGVVGRAVVHPVLT